MSMLTNYTAARVIALTCFPAAAGPGFCAERDQIAERLASAYSEQLLGAGMQSETSMFEVWASPEGTWTILLTRPDGVACVMATGTNWVAAASRPVGTLN